jgi:hypothetical protein
MITALEAVPANPELVVEVSLAIPKSILATSSS